MIDHPAVLFGAFPVAAYVIGSTPVGVILAGAKGVNLRAVGSGNVGATNVGRALGRRWGILCFVLDVLKGFVPVVLAGAVLRSLSGFPTAAHQAAWLAAGFGTIAGHVFSFWLKFRGGKGVATALGVVLGVFPYFTWAGLAAFAIWIGVALASRYVSLASVTAALSFVPLLVLSNAALLGWSETARLWPLGLFAAAMVTLIVIRHRANIRRLLAGTENKIGPKRTPPEA